MTASDCSTVRGALEWAEPLTEDARVHLGNCTGCNEIATEWAVLDDLLSSEPVLLAPAELVGAVGSVISWRRRRETVWFRVQVMLMTAAALLIVGLGALSLPMTGIEMGVDDEPDLVSEVGPALQDVSLRFGVALDQALTTTLSTPHPSLIVLLCLAPLLLVINWSICRVRTGGQLAS